MADKLELVPKPKVRRSRRVGISRSNLVDPQTPIHVLASQFQRYMHLPDPSALYVVMGTLAANMLSGQPVWLMLVGPSGGGKTKLLKSLRRLEKVRPVSSIKGEAALLSGVKAKDRAKDSTGGLLKELGDHACLLFLDFTSVLSKSEAVQNEIIGALREIYDRTWSRDLGTEGGRNISYTGKVALVAGCTHAIDRHATATDEMGTRSVYFRLPETSGYQEAMSAVQDIDPQKSEEDMELLVESMFHGLDLSLANPQLRRKLETGERDRIVQISQLGSRARSPVVRDFRREVVDVPTPEVCTRMAGELSQLFCGLEVLGLEPQESWQVIEKVALDSMPLARRLVIRAVVEGQHTRRLIAESVRISEAAAARAIEDLHLLGVLRKLGVGGGADGHAQKWLLTEWAEERLKGRKGEEVTDDESDE